MDKWSIISQVLGLAIGAGLNLYAAVLVTGLGLRYGLISNLPGELSLLAHPAVLIAAGVMYVAEFVADKVPFFTPIWDAVHTFIRPIGGALLALSATADLDPVVRAIAMIVAGSLALGTHSSKMGFRLMAHTAPEPTTHSAISVAEDFGVVVLLALAYQYPHIAVPVFVLIIVGIAMFVPLLLRILRFLIAGLMGRVVSWFSAIPSDDVPEWVPDRKNAVRAFARSAKGAPKLASGWLHPASGQFHFRRFGVKKVLDAGAVEPGVNWGLVYNVVRTEAGATFYVTKEWCEGLTCSSQTS